MASQEVPIRPQREPHVSGPGELAVEVKGFSLQLFCLELANGTAFRPAVRHAIDLFQPLKLHPAHLAAAL